MSKTTKADSTQKRTIFQRLCDALRADAALHDITDAQFMNGEDPLTARPVLPAETPATMTSDTDAHRVIRQIAECAENIAFAAGVGSLETAGQIVSFLWARPSLMADFMAGKLDAVDTGLLDHHNGVLSWHGMDGGIHRPDPSKARFPAPPFETLGKRATPAAAPSKTTETQRGEGASDP